MMIGALLSEPAACARLREAVKPYGTVRICERQDELIALVENDLASVVVLDIWDRDGEETLPTVRAIRDAFPSVPVLLYCRMGPETSRALVEHVRAGVNDLVLRDVDDLRDSIRNAIAAAQDHCASRSVLGDLQPHVPHSVLPFLEYCLQNGRRQLTVEGVSAALGVHRRTMGERLGAAGFPSPGALIAWCRLLVAARLLEDRGRSIEQVALVLDFPSGSALRNMFRRYTGLGPTEVRQNGGLRCVLHAFRKELSIIGSAEQTR